jgi:hypothetical protein
MWLEQAMEWPLVGAGRSLAMARFTSTSVYPNPDEESTSVDGECSNGNFAAWSTVHDASSGTGDDASATSNTPTFKGHTTTNEWISMGRTFMLFDTGAAIDAGQTKDSATFEFTASTKTDDFTDSVSMVTSTPASNTAIANGDFDQTTNTKQATDITVDSIDAGGSNYNAMTLNATGLGNIALGGISKFGLKTLYDLNDSPPTWGSGSITRIHIKMADTSGTSADPKLVVLHSAPFTPTAIFF